MLQKKTSNHQQLYLTLHIYLSTFLFAVGKSDKEAKDIIIKTDKSRASYYNYYTNKKWGSAKDYNLCIDSGKLP